MNDDDGRPVYRITAETRFRHLTRKGYYYSLSLIIVAGLGACNLPERSRSLGDPDIAAKTLALQICSNCHGAQGVSISPNFPNLAAQSQSYLVAQLKSFKSHGRSDPAGFEYMWGISARLSEDQINGLAAYFSEQSPPPGKSGNQALLKEGQKIFEQGIAASNMPACSGCHGAHGERIQQFPRLAGQHADYIVKQLMVYQRTDDRPEGVMMKGIAHELTPLDMKNVAAYLEAMAPRAIACPGKAIEFK